MSKLLFIPSGYEEDFMFEDFEETKPIPSPSPCADIYLGGRGSELFAEHSLPVLLGRLEKNVIELGPGSHGGLAPELIAAGKHYTGLDINSNHTLRAQAAQPNATYLVGHLTDRVQELKGPASIISTNVLDLIRDSSAGQTYMGKLTDAITALARPGTLSVHYAQEQPHLPRTMFAHHMQERGWRREPFTTPYGHDSNATLVLTYKPDVTHQ